MENENKNKEYNEKKDMANQYFKEGKYEEAIKLYSDILETDENNHVILSNRSAAYIKLENWDEALKDAVKIGRAHV